MSDPPPLYKILIAHYQSEVISGAEYSIADFVENADKNFQFTMLIPRPGNLSEYYQKRGLNVWVHNIETPRRKYPGLHEVQSRLFVRQIKQHQVNLIIGNTFSAASRIKKICQYAHLPHTNYIREYVPLNRKNQAVLNQINHIFAISQDLSAHLAEAINPKNIHLTYNFINKAPFLEKVERHRQQGSRILPFNINDPVIGLIGRITPFKQQDLFIRCIPSVLKKFPAAKFILVGSAQPSDADYEQRLKTIVENLGIQRNLLFMGQRTDIAEITSELTISCLTSTREPLGRVILEAGIIGIPVIAANSGGAAEIVIDQVSGLSFDSTHPNAPEILAEKIILLLHNEGFRNQLISHANQRINQLFASQNPILRQETLIEEIIHESKKNIGK